MMNQELNDDDRAYLCRLHHGLSQVYVCMGVCDFFKMSSDFDILFVTRTDAPKL